MERKKWRPKETKKIGYEWFESFRDECTRVKLQEHHHVKTNTNVVTLVRMLPTLDLSHSWE